MIISSNRNLHERCIWAENDRNCKFVWIIQALRLLQTQDASSEAVEFYFEPAKPNVRNCLDY